MNSSTNNSGPVQIIKASYALQQKVGSGPLNPTLMARCVEVMNAAAPDFAPTATGFLDRLNLALQNAYKDPENLSAHLEDLTRPVMELKANARMFRYNLVTTLANIMLIFLEGIQKLDHEALEIVKAHHMTLSVIIKQKMIGDGGPSGALLTRELRDVCNRYFQKRGMPALPIGVI